jgi:hypothetical protein
MPRDLTVSANTPAMIKPQLEAARDVFETNTRDSARETRVRKPREETTSNYANNLHEQEVHDLLLLIRHLLPRSNDGSL